MATSLDTAPSQVGIILLGNVGVGKSFLANILLGKSQFRSAPGAKAVTTATQKAEVTIGNATYTIFDIPGLIEANQDAIERNKNEIYKAFDSQPNSVVGFVFNATGGGRLRQEDVVAFNALQQAYNFEGKSLLLIINGVPDDCESNYEGEMIFEIKSIMVLPEMTQFCFLPRINKKNEAEFDRLGREFIRGIVTRAAVEQRKVQDICLELEQINALKDQVRQQQEAFESRIDKMAAEIKQQQESYEAYRQETEAEMEKSAKINRVVGTGLQILGAITLDPLLIGLGTFVLLQQAKKSQPTGQSQPTESQPTGQSDGPN